MLFKKIMLQNNSTFVNLPEKQHSFIMLIHTYEKDKNDLSLRLELKEKNTT